MNSKLNPLLNQKLTTAYKKLLVVWSLTITICYGLGGATVLASHNRVYCLGDRKTSLLTASMRHTNMFCHQTGVMPR